MPVYNQERYLSAAVDSILAQTFKDFEFVIVNDGSTDGTNEILARLNDGRVRLIKLERQGFLQALAHGVRAAQGKWVARMDSDDVTHPDRLRQQLNFLNEHPDCLFVGSVYGIITPNDKYLVPRTTFAWRYLEPRDITLATELFADPSAVFDREQALAVGLYDPDFENEKPLYYKLLSKGQGAVLGMPLHFLRWRLGSHSRSEFQKRSIANRDIRLRYNPADAELDRIYHFENHKVAAIKAAYRCVDYYLLAGDYQAAREVAVETWRTWPFDLQTSKIVLKALLKRPNLKFWDEPDTRFVPPTQNGPSADHERNNATRSKTEPVSARASTAGTDN